jgi:hypothetical protein
MCDPLRGTMGPAAHFISALAPLSNHASVIFACRRFEVLDWARERGWRKNGCIEYMGTSAMPIPLKPGRTPAQQPSRLKALVGPASTAPTRGFFGRDVAGSFRAD